MCARVRACVLLLLLLLPCLTWPGVAQMDRAETAVLELRLRHAEQQAAVLAYQRECLADGKELLQLQRLQAARLGLGETAGLLQPVEQSLRDAMHNFSGYYTVCTLCLSRACVPIDFCG